MKKMSPAGNAAWIIWEKIFALVLSFAVNLAIARHLAPEQFGSMSYILAIVGLSTPIGTLGLNGIVTRELVRRPEDVQQIIGTSIALRFLGLLASGLICVSISPALLDPELIPIFGLLLLGNLWTSAQVIEFWLHAHVASSNAVKARMIILVLLSLIRLLAVHFGATVQAFLLLVGVEYALTGMGFIYIYHLGSDGIRKLRWCATEAKKLLRESCWLMLSGMAAIVYLKMDQVLLGKMSSTTEVGIYSVGARLSESWYFFPSAIVVSFFPQLLNSKSMGQAAYHRQLQRLNDFLCSTAFVVAIMVSAWSEEIVTLLFGSEYSRAGQVLSIHVWSGIFIFMRELLSKWLIAEGLIKISLMTQLSGALLNLVLNLVLIPRHGAVGSAFATLISYSVASYFALFFYRETRVMARVMTLSMILPVRLLWFRRRLYH
jgi:O-antigen/teichoic acid export membrane protein